MTKEETMKIVQCISFLEINYNIRFNPKEMPGYIEGFVICRNGQYCITINENLSYEEQLRTLYHEAKHIYDIEIGIDTSENDCDSFADSYYKITHKGIVEIDYKK